MPLRWTRQGSPCGIIGMTKFTSKLLVILAASIGSLGAQEAWILEMPNKYSDYLIKKAVEGDQATVDGIVEKLPGLIAKKQIREIELITWKADGGKNHPKKMATIAGQERQLGSFYRSSGGGPNERRNFNITTITTEKNYNIDLFGKLAKTWTPTFSHRTEKETLLVLERNPFDGDGSLKISHTRQVSLDSTSKSAVTWYAASSMDDQLLSFSEQSIHPANEKMIYGVRFLTVTRKGGDTLLRMEAHSTSPSAKDFLTLSHNEATFKGHSQTTGPLKKETIKIVDKSFTDDGESGSWTLTLTGE